SASSFFSFAFSSSRAFRRLASDTSIPPYFAFQLYSVASETPCLRARSPAFAPASCSRRTAMICSSVNRFRFIRPSFDQGPDSNLRWRKNSVAGHNYPPELELVVARQLVERLPNFAAFENDKQLAAIDSTGKKIWKTKSPT